MKVVNTLFTRRRHPAKKAKRESNLRWMRDKKMEQGDG